MRRKTLVEPQSRAARWSLRITLLGAATALVGALGARTDWIDGLQGATALAAGLAIAMIGAAIAAIALARIWVNGYRGGRYGVIALVLFVALAAGPAWVIAQGIGLPALNDVTTDVDDPPAFDLVTRARPATANPTAYPRAFAPLQRAAYPDVRPLDLDIGAEQINEIVSDVAEAFRVRILDEVEFTGPTGEGRIEGAVRSLALGFRDDIVIRIRAVDGRVRIDIRSASRYGRHDFGVNARRVQAMLEDIRLAARRTPR